MKILIRIIALTALFFTQFNSIHSQFDPQQIKTIDSALTILSNKDQFNGVVLLAEHGKIVYEKYAGNTAFNSTKKISRQSAFNLASNSKQFVSMMVMQLKEQNKLNYDHKVQQYLPNFPYPTITIRHLLTHTAGLPEYFDLVNQYTHTLDTLNNHKLIQLFAEHKPALHFTPGDQWEYCNTGYVLLASIIEQAAQQHIAQFFSEFITKPLALNNTFIYYLNIDKKYSPTQERVTGIIRVNGQHQLNDLIRLDGVIGDGNIYSSAEDMLKWDQALYTNQLISKESLTEAFTPVKLNNGQTHPYGFGWGISNNGQTVSHTGSWVGFRNSIERRLDKNNTIILLTNGNNGIARTVVNEILNNKVPSIPYTELITNVQLIDGTGVPAIKTSVRLKNDRILEIGNLTPFKQEKVINGNGLVLAPGFIDTHSHHFGGLKSNPSATPTANQGITTITIGQDGESYAMDSLVDFFKRNPVAVNVASYTGHTTLRRAALGNDHVLGIATDTAINLMKTALASEMKKGSLGLASGLEYESAFYSNKNEVIELAKIAAAYNGRYISHIRSEDIHLNEAIDEIIEIGAIAKLPVQISHIKISIKDQWKTAPQLIAKLQAARSNGINITADIYPYNFWNSTLRILFPNRDYTSLTSAQFAVDQLFDANQSVLIHFAPMPNYEGKTIAAIAQIRKEKTAITLMKLIEMAAEFDLKNPQFTGNTETIMGKSMDDQDVSDLISWPQSNICSDGSSGGHPRGYGSFTKVLSKYVREEKLLPLETAIYKMTGLSAEHLGITDRGIIRPGNYADLVLFNPATVKDNSSIQNGKALSTGIEKVWINGKIIYQQQKSTGLYPGVLIKRQN